MSAATTRPARPSRRVCIAAARFGMTLEQDHEARVPEARAMGGAGCAALAVDAMLRRGGVALIEGPSGGGKTTLLRRIAAATASRIVDVDARRLRDAAASGRAVIDLFCAPLDTSLRLLASAGLAEAPLLVRPARRLSEGERFRLRLALAMERALRLAVRDRGGPVTLMADEFCACLDAPTSASVCAGLSRWVRASGVRLIAASAREDLRAPLRPDVIATTSFYKGPEVRYGAGAGTLDARGDEGGLCEAVAIPLLRGSAGDGRARAGGR